MTPFDICYGDGWHRGWHRNGSTVSSLVDNDYDSTTKISWLFPLSIEQFIISFFIQNTRHLQVQIVSVVVFVAASSPAWFSVSVIIPYYLRLLIRFHIFIIQNLVISFNARCWLSLKTQWTTWLPWMTRRCRDRNFSPKKNVIFLIRDRCLRCSAHLQAPCLKHTKDIIDAN